MAIRSQLKWPHPTRIFAFLFHDQARLIEMVSALNLLAWAKVFFAAPDVLDRASYAMFQSLPASAWILIFLSVGLVQALGMFAWHRRAIELRFVAMALATGCWALIGSNFMINTVASTATASYTLLALATALAGGFLGWKTSSSPS